MILWIRRKSSERKKNIIGILLIMLLLIGCADKEIKQSSEGETRLKEPIVLPDGSIVNTKGRIKLAENSVSYGFYDPSGNFVAGGEKLPVEGDKIKTTIHFQQNIPGESVEYMLIMLIDYMQQNFSVQNKNYRNYIFSLEKEGEVEIDVELPLQKGDKTLSFLIIPKPEEYNLNFDTNEGRNNIADTHRFHSVTCYLDNKDKEEIIFSQEIVGYTGANKNISMVEDIDTQEVITSCTGGENVKIVLGNSYSYKKSYIMFAFLGWEQSWIDDKPYQVFELEPERGYYYDLNIPMVKDVQPYQVFLLEDPFSPTHSGWNLCTMRTIVKP